MEEFMTPTEALEWVSENTPTLLEMVKPLDEEQAGWFAANYMEDVWQETFENMENWIPLTKKSKSASLTAKKWLRMRGWLPFDKMDKESEYVVEAVMGSNSRAMQIFRNRRRL